jgi:hypothetical protein
MKIQMNGYTKWIGVGVSLLFLSLSLWGLTLKEGAFRQAIQNDISLGVAMGVRLSEVEISDQLLQQQQIDIKRAVDQIASNQCWMLRIMTKDMHPRPPLPPPCLSP